MKEDNTLLEYEHLGNIILGETKQIELELKNHKNTDLECELIINSDWLECSPESKMLFLPEETKKIIIRLNSLNVLPGNHWSEALLYKTLTKEIIFRKVYIASFIPPRLDKDYSENSRPLIKVTGDGTINFGEIKVKVTRNTCDIKEKNHVLTICNESQSDYFRGYISTGERWIKFDNKPEIVIAPGRNKDVNILLDMEEIEKQHLSYGKGRLVITNNSYNQPEIICSFELSAIFDYPPYPMSEPEEIKLGNITPGIYSKEIVLLNSGGKLLEGYISMIPQWIDIDFKDIKISPDEKQILSLNINISSELSDRVELKDNIKIVFKESSDVKELDIPVSARVDKRIRLVTIIPEELDIGNIIKGTSVKKSFELIHNNFSPVKARITCQEKWIKFLSAVRQDNKKILSKENSLELDINPDEKWTFEFNIDTNLCFSDMMNRGEIKVEFINSHTSNKFININLYPMDAKNFLIDFGQYPVSLGNIKSGENITKEIEIKYLGFRKDIILAGNIISLTEWLKINTPDFIIKPGESSVIKIQTSFLAGNCIGRKEGIILVNLQPDKCIPNIHFLPQQIETISINIYEEANISEGEKVAEKNVREISISKEEKVIDNTPHKINILEE